MIIEKMKFWAVSYLPRWVVYWSAIRLGVFATSGTKYLNTNIPDLTLLEAIRRWDDNMKPDADISRLKFHASVSKKGKKKNAGKNLEKKR